MKRDTFLTSFVTDVCMTRTYPQSHVSHFPLSESIESNLDILTSP